MNESDSELLNVLKSVLSYNKKTGIFKWKKTLSNKAIKGRIAGTSDHEGYIKIRVFYKEYRASRLAWFFCFKQWPMYYIDHINGIRTDNRISNLRDVNQRTNCQNRKHHRNGRLFGAQKSNSIKNPFVSQIFVNGKHIRIGLFKTEKEAHEAYLKKQKELKNEGVI